MASLENYYRKIPITILEDTQLSRRVRTNLDKIIKRLPDEDQFTCSRGSILIGRGAWFDAAIGKLADNYQFAPHVTLMPDGNHVYNLTIDPKNSSVFITLNLSSLEERPDDFIEGLIACKFVQWSMVGRQYYYELVPKLKKAGKKAQPIILMSFHKNLPRIGSAEYEASFNNEAKRLGFSKEVQAYDTHRI